MKNETRAKFGSKLGIILASAGSAVGLGNVWRFPFETGNNGGAAFIFIYIGCVLLLGLPIMVAEFMIGRKSGSNAVGAYKQLSPGSKWHWLGALGVLTAFLILGYYTVVAGWTLEYTWQAALNTFQGQSPQFFVNEFNTFSTDIFRPLFWLVVFMLATHFIIMQGVEKGIEKFSKIMMPALFIIILILVVCSITLPGAGEGISYLLKPDFSKVTGKVFLSAMGQAFFSLSVGMGCLCTYASYFSKDTNLGKTAFSVGAIDTIVAILAGFIIFPAAFSVGIQPDAGPSLIFITLPNIFQQAFSGVPVIAYVFSVMFYLLLAIAALTSTISVHEVVTAYLNEEYHIERKKAAWVTTIGALIVGILSSLSLGVMKDCTLFGLGVFDLIDFSTTKLMLPIGGMLVSIYVGWVLNKQLVKEEITNQGKVMKHIYLPLILILRYFAPVAILLILLNQLGII